MLQTHSQFSTTNGFPATFPGEGMSFAFPALAGRPAGSESRPGPYLVYAVRKEPDAAWIRSRETAVQSLLLYLGFPLSLKGAVCLRHAMLLLLENPSYLVTAKGLYHMIGNRCGFSDETVNQAIRHAVRLCWQRMPPESGRRPGNHAFLAWMLEKLRDPIWWVPGQDDSPPLHLK